LGDIISNNQISAFFVNTSHTWTVPLVFLETTKTQNLSNTVLYHEYSVLTVLGKWHIRNSLYQQVKCQTLLQIISVGKWPSGQGTWSTFSDLWSNIQSAPMVKVFGHMLKHIQTSLTFL